MDMAQFAPTPQRTFGDNAGGYNTMWGQADTANQQYQQDVGQWEQSRAGYADYLQDQTYQNQMAQVGFQQQDAYRNNKFAQARGGMTGGSADMGAQARIAQQGVYGQGQAYLAGQQAQQGQLQADANQAQGMRQQGFSLYDSANQYGNFAAQNQMAASGALTGMQRQSDQAGWGADAELASLGGAYRGGQIGSAMGALGHAGGSYLGNQYNPRPANAPTTKPVRTEL